MNQREPWRWSLAGLQKHLEAVQAEYDKNPTPRQQKVLEECKAYMDSTTPEMLLVRRT